MSEYNKNSVGAAHLSQGFDQKKRKKAFRKGFFKRSTEYCVKPEDAGALYEHLIQTYMKPTSLKEALGKKAFFTHDHDSLYDISDHAKHYFSGPKDPQNVVDGNIAKNQRSQLEELVKHLLSRSGDSTAAGAGIGAVGGLAKAHHSKDKRYGRDALIGAGIGGAAGLGAGVYHDAHQVAENTRHVDLSKLHHNRNHDLDLLGKLRNYNRQSDRHHQLDDHDLQQQIDDEDSDKQAVKKSPWMSYYFNPTNLHTPKDLTPDELRDRN